MPVCLICIIFYCANRICKEFRSFLVAHLAADCSEHATDCSCEACGNRSEVDGTGLHEIVDRHSVVGDFVGVLVEDFIVDNRLDSDFVNVIFIAKKLIFNINQSS